MAVYSTALVTGASSGIGAEFARQLAAQGSNLVLVARSEDKLRALASELSALHGVQAEVVTADLSRPDAAEQVWAKVQELGMTIDLLVNNAGFGQHGPFETLGGAREQEQVAVNVSAVVAMTRLFLPPMLARGAGGVINVASTAGFQPVAFMAVYGASKAFVLSFSEALWAECRGRGVRVLAFCPGATETPFFATTGETAALGPKASPENVVKAALRALGQSRLYLIPGARNYWLTHSTRLMPRTLIAEISARMMRPPRSASA